MRTLYRASQVLTLSHPPVGEWVLVDDRHIQRVGSGETPQADRVVDLPGATIIPGFIDSHVHLTGTGIHEASPEAAQASSARELVAAMRDVAAASRGPTLVHGYDESKWTDASLPRLAELDAVLPEPVIAVRADGHASLANTPALERAKALDLPGVERDATGSPTGLVTLGANDRLKRWFSEQLTESQIQEYQLAAAAMAASRGVTAVHEMSLPHERGLRDLEVLLGHRDRLPVDVVIYIATTDVPQAIDLRLARIGGDLPLDGSIGARTAHLSSPYRDADGSGVGYHPDDELIEFFRNAHLAGLQIGVHAIGDEAIEQALRVWEQVYQALDSRGRRHFRARRHRIEHFELPDPGQVERTAMLGLAVSVNPSFDAEWGHRGGLYDGRLGWDRAAGMNPFRSLVDRGIEVGVGSDSPITPLDPIRIMQALENHHDPAQRFSRDDAVRLLTTGSARLAHQEDKKGGLEAGIHADFAAYDDDPTTAASPGDLRPVLTVSLGREVFAA